MSGDVLDVKNRDLDATWAYHNATKHSYASVCTNPHFLDWENMPLPFKVYPTLKPLSLPRDFPPSGMAALSAVSAMPIHPRDACVPDLKTLAGILFYAAGVTRRKSYPGGEIFFRAAACTGALYHIDLYLICGNLPDLQAGVYHFGPHDFALRRLRGGDYRATVVHATGREPSVTEAPVIIVCTGTYWRNAWKYRTRTYRHCFWDNGTILANLLAIAAYGVPARVVGGFVDDSVNRLLDLDPEREVTLTLVPLGRDARFPTHSLPAGSPLALETLPLSKKVVDYPVIRAMHAASSLASEEEVTAWRCAGQQAGGDTPAAAMSAASGRLFTLRPLDDAEIPRDPIEQVILRRGSTRQFAREPITFTDFSTILWRATRGVPADFLEPPGASLSDLYLIVNAVQDLPAGAYVFHRDTGTLELLREGDFRAQAGYLGLGQELPANASANIFFLADLKPVLQRFGNRGYRVAQLDAAIAGGKLYLSAYALRVGATGLTFFDDDVTEFFSPHAEGKSVMFLVALGIPAKHMAN